MKISLTDRETDVMQVLWDHGPSLVAEVRVRLSDELAYSTVLTVLRTFEGKGYVGREEEGRGHRYFASIKQQAARKNALRHLTDKLFKGLGGAALHALGVGTEARHGTDASYAEAAYRML